MTSSSGPRSFVFEGHRLRLNEDPGVRAADIAGCRLTVIREDDGATLVIDPAELELPPLPGIPPPGPLYNPRLLIEEVLRLGFDDRWLEMIVDWMKRQRLFMRSGKAGSDGAE
jgi:hypothetical protein